MAVTYKNTVLQLMDDIVDIKWLIFVIMYRFDFEFLPRHMLKF